MKKLLLILPMIMLVFDAYGASKIELDCGDMSLTLVHDGYQELNILEKNIPFMNNVSITDDSGESEDLFLSEWPVADTIDGVYVGGVRTLIVHDVAGKADSYTYRIGKTFNVYEDRHCVVK